MPSILTCLLSVLQRWFGWEWAVLVVWRDDDVRTLKLPDDLPVSVRPNTDGSVALTVGHDDHGEALLADLRALMGTGYQAPSDRVALPGGRRSRRARG